MIICDLIAVRVSSGKGPFENGYMLNAICEWLDKIAGDRPLVISCSFGGQYGGRDGYQFDGVEVAATAPGSVTLVEDGIAATYAVRVDGAAVEVDGPLGHARLVERPRFTDPAEQHPRGSLLAPMPGTVVSVAVQSGDQVEAGAPVLVLEAMKMQHTVSAPHAGTVTEIDVQPGTQVAAGDVLAVVEEEQE